MTMKRNNILGIIIIIGVIVSLFLLAEISGRVFII